MKNRNAILLLILAGCGGGGGGGGDDGTGVCETVVLKPAGSTVDLDLVPAAGPGTGGTGGALGLTSRTSSYGGYTFTYWVYMPAGYAGASTPILYMYHGSGGNGEGAVTPWIPEAEANGFIVAGISSQISSQWNGLDDAVASEGMRLEIDAMYNVDTTKRYICGMSAGAHFTYWLALNDSEYYAAFAPIAGGNSADLPVPRKIPAVILHGRNDSVVTFELATQARDDLYAAGHVVITHFCDRGHVWDADHDNPFIWSWLRHFAIGNP